VSSIGNFKMKTDMKDFEQIGDNMIWKNSALHQIGAFKSLATKLDCEMKVVSSHHSKSIELPVVELTMAEVGTFTIRDNFYDINLKADLSFDFFKKLSCLLHCWL